MTATVDALERLAKEHLAQTRAQTAQAIQVLQPTTADWLALATRVLTQPSIWRREHRAWIRRVAPIRACVVDLARRDPDPEMDVALMALFNPTLAIWTKAVVTEPSLTARLLQLLPARKYVTWLPLTPTDGAVTAEAWLAQVPALWREDQIQLWRSVVLSGHAAWIAQLQQSPVTWTTDARVTGLTTALENGLTPLLPMLEEGLTAHDHAGLSPAVATLVHREHWPTWEAIAPRLGQGVYSQVSLSYVMASLAKSGGETYQGLRTASYQPLDSWLVRAAPYIAQDPGAQATRERLINRLGEEHLPQEIARQRAAFRRDQLDTTATPTRHRPRRRS